MLVSGANLRKRSISCLRTITKSRYIGKLCKIIFIIIIVIINSLRFRTNIIIIRHRGWRRRRGHIHRYIVRCSFIIAG